MEILQGDIYWIDMGEPAGAEPGYRHPHVVVQNSVFNRSRISTVVVCALTTNLYRAESPGNVLLDGGEGNLSKQSVVNVTQLYTVDKRMLGPKIGSLSAGRMAQIITGIQLVISQR